MLLLRGLVRDVFLKPAQEAGVNKTTGEVIKAQPPTHFAVVEHHGITHDGVAVLQMVNVKLVDQADAFKAAIGKEIMVPCGHGQMNRKDWYNVPKGHLPIVQTSRAA